jgi:hypothetical protein
MSCISIIFVSANKRKISLLFIDKFCIKGNAFILPFSGGPAFSADSAFYRCALAPRGRSAAASTGGI